MEQRILNKLKNEQLKILDYIVSFCEKNRLEYFLIGGTLLGAVRHKGYIPWDDDLDIAMPRKDYEKFICMFLKYNNDKFILDEGRASKLYWLPFLKIRNKKTIYQESLQKKYKGNLGIWVDIFPLDNAEKDYSRKESFQFRFVKNWRYIITRKLNVETKKKHPLKDFLCKIVGLLPLKVLFKIQNYVMTLDKNDNSKYFINLGSQYGPVKQTHLKSKYYPIKKLEFEGKKYNVPNDYKYVLTKIYGNDYMQLPPIEKRITHNPMFIKFEDGEEVIFNEKV